MADLQSVKKLLAEEYGIHSDQDLNEALNRMEKIDIGVFTTPVSGKEVSKHGKDLCIA